MSALHKCVSFGNYSVCKKQAIAADLCLRACFRLRSLGYVRVYFESMGDEYWGLKRQLPHK